MGSPKLEVRVDKPIYRIGADRVTIFVTLLESESNSKVNVNIIQKSTNSIVKNISFSSVIASYMVLIWDLRDDSGNFVDAGAYFIKAFSASNYGQSTDFQLI